MKRLFVDTNIIIDFLADRKPFAHSAAALFENALMGKIKIYISAVSYNNIYYILRQSLSHKETLHLLIELSEMAEIVDVTKNIINSALKSDFRDFEDAIQYHCALTVSKIEIIVTRDTKDYKKSKLAVMTSEEVMNVIAG